MANHKKKKFQSSHKYHKQTDISGPNRLLSRRLSSQIELAALTAGSFAAQTAYISEVDDLDMLPEVDMEVNNNFYLKYSHLKSILIW